MYKLINRLYFSQYITLFILKDQFIQNIFLTFLQYSNRMRKLLKKFEHVENRKLPENEQ